MLIPLLLTLIVSWFSSLKDLISNINYRKFFRFWKLYQREIPSVAIEGPVNTTQPGDNRNEVLVKAIEHYNDHNNVMSTLNAVIHLASDERKLAEHGDETTPSLSQALQHYRIVKKIPIQTWVQLGKFGKDKERKYKVKLFISEDIDNLDSDTGSRRGTSARRITRTLFFQSYGKNSIDTYIDQAYKWYVKNLEKLDDEGR
jgi:hypothetical protein